MTETSELQSEGDKYILLEAETRNSCESQNWLVEKHMKEAMLASFLTGSERKY